MNFNSIEIVITIDTTNYNNGKDYQKNKKFYITITDNCLKQLAEERYFKQEKNKKIIIVNTEIDSINIV